MSTEGFHFVHGINKIKSKNSFAYVNLFPKKKKINKEKHSLENLN